MAGLVYLKVILSIMLIGVLYAIFRRVWNIVADLEIAGFKLPKL